MEPSVALFPVIPVDSTQNVGLPVVGVGFGLPQQQRQPAAQLQPPVAPAQQDSAWMQSMLRAVDALVLATLALIHHLLAYLNRRHGGGSLNNEESTPPESDAQWVSTSVDRPAAAGTMAMLPVRPVQFGRQASVPGAVAANQQARAYGDPHIEGGDGERFDFNEHGIFSLLEDRGLSLNAEMGPAAGEKSVITNVGLAVNNQRLQVLPNGTVILNGSPLALRENQPVTLPDGTRIVKQGNNVQVATNEYDLTFTSRAGGQYLDVAANTRAEGVASDGVAPTGILGETFDSDETAGSNTKHPPEFYRRRSLLAF
jgi:hypothetical protein